MEYLGKKPLKAFESILRKFNYDNCFRWAGFLSYVTILAIVPLIILSFSFFSSFAKFLVIKEKMMDYLLKFLVPQSAKAVIEYINSFSAQSKALGIGGILGLISLSYVLFEASESAFNEIWHSFKKRTKLNKIFVFTNLLFWGPILLGTSFYLSRKIISIPHVGILSKFSLFLFPLFISIFVFSLFFLIIPVGRVGLKAALFGGVISSFLWEIAKHGFEFYIKNAISFKAFTVLYGPFVILPIFLFWIYLSWLITLFGAEVTYYVQFGGNRINKEDYSPNFVISLSILAIIIRNFMEGKRSTSEEALIMKMKTNGNLIREALSFLEKENLVVFTNSGYLPTLPPERIKLSTFFQPFILDIIEDKWAKKTIENVRDSLGDITLRDLLWSEVAVTKPQK